MTAARITIGVAVVASILTVVAAVSTSASEITPLRLHNVLVYQQGALLTSLSQHAWPERGYYDVRIALPESTNRTIPRNVDENFQLHLRPKAASGDSATHATQAMSASSAARVVRSKMEIIANPVIQEQMDNLTQSITEMKDQRDDIKDAQLRISSDEQWLTNVVRAITEPRSNYKDASNVFSDVQMFDAVQRMSAQTATNTKLRRELLRQDDKLNSGIKEAQSKLEELRASSLHVRVLHVTVEVETPGEYELELKWVSLAASWIPSYDISIDTSTASADAKKAPLSLQYYAKIRQLTGLIWDQVAIQLSTGSVHTRQEATPTLSPWRLNFINHHQPHHEAARSFAPTSTSVQPTSSMTHQYGGRLGKQSRSGQQHSGGDDDEAESGAPSGESIFDGLESVQQGISDVFTLKGLHTVGQEADPASAARVPIAVLGFQVNLTAIIFPSRSTSAFLRAEFVNDSPLSLLRGKGQAFLDGGLLGIVTVPFTGTGGSKCAVDLGTDRTIEVTRHLSQAATADSQSGFFTTTKYRSVSRDVIITVENKRSSAVDVIVRELVPQPSHNAIHVTLREPHLSSPVEEALKSPENFVDGLTMPLGNNATLVKYPGMLEWKRHIPANSRKTIFFGFDVSWSRDERRDVNLDL